MTIIDAPQPVDRISSIAAFVVFQTPVRLMSISNFQWSARMRSMGMKVPIPASPQTKSSPPSRCAARASSAVIVSRSRTSASLTLQRRPRWDQGIRSTERLHAELRDGGYRGSLRTLGRLTARLRQGHRCPNLS